MRIKKEEMKAGSIKEVKASVAEDRRTNARKDWRVAALAVLCYFWPQKAGGLGQGEGEGHHLHAGGHQDLYLPTS